MKKYPFGSAAALALAIAFTLGNSPISRAADSDGASADDPYIWLEEVEGEAALEWVAEQNALSLPRLEGDARFEPLRA